METTTKDYRDGFWHGARIIQEHGLPNLLDRVRHAARQTVRLHDYNQRCLPCTYLAGMIDAALEQAQRSNAAAWE